MAGSAGFVFALGATRCEATELVLPSRGSGQPEQISSCLPSEDRDVLPLIIPLLFPKMRLAQRIALRTGCRSIAASVNVGIFGSPKLDI